MSQLIEGAALGASGEVRVRYRSEGSASWLESAWREVDRDADFTTQIELTGLEAATRYEIAVEGRGNSDASVSAVIEGGFRTTPPATEEIEVVFTVTTGTAYNDLDAPGSGLQDIR